MQAEQGPTDWTWAWILVGCATVIAFILVLSQNAVFFIKRHLLGAHAVQFGLRVRSSALFNWLLLVLDFAIGFFFLLLLLVTGGLLFDGFHDAWGAPDVLAQAHVVGTLSLTAVCVTFVWVGMAIRVVHLVRLFSHANQRPAQQQRPQQRHQQQQQPQPPPPPPREEEQEDARPQAFSGHPALDYCLFVLVGMTLLRAFRWPSFVLTSDADSPLQVGLFSVAVMVMWSFLLHVTVQLRMRLHRQIASIGTP